MYGYVAGFLWFFGVLLLRMTQRVKVTGTENLSADSNYIFLPMA